MVRCKKANDHHHTNFAFDSLSVGWGKEAQKNTIISCDFPYTPLSRSVGLDQVVQEKSNIQCEDHRGNPTIYQGSKAPRQEMHGGIRSHLLQG